MALLLSTSIYSVYPPSSSYIGTTGLANVRYPIIFPSSIEPCETELVSVLDADIFAPIESHLLKSFSKLVRNVYRLKSVPITIPS